jgi:hypothetical protein
MTFAPTAASAAFLERVATELDVPPGRYEEAKRRYKSVGEWLGRDESTLKDLSPEVYVQGSFRLGTPIRPVNEDEHYDLDLVCELDASKSSVTQKELKRLLGVEMQLYAKHHGMTDVSESRRCWTLDYAAGAQFHLDALPAIRDAGRKRAQLEARSLSTTWVETAIAITDIDHPLYEVHCVEWPHSNPKGYTNWFRSRMREAFERQRAAMALEAKANVEDVPSYQVKTPLQQAVQILKRHRDIRFAADPDNKPISIIITTLAGLSYHGESNVSYAIQAILAGMDSHIETRGGVAWIPNPTDPEENFADRWAAHPQRKQAFFDWLAVARDDFSRLGALTSREQLSEQAAPFFGARVARVASVAASRHAHTGLSLFQRTASVFLATHKKPAPWQHVRGGTARISEATLSRSGFRTRRFSHDGTPLPKGVSLSFKADTDVPWPYEVHWQVVNTGPEAAAVQGGLRGGFDVGTVSRGSIVRQESTAYSGTHTIECFIVKNGYLVARSGAFVVNIA